MYMTQRIIMKVKFFLNDRFPGLPGIPGFPQFPGHLDHRRILKHHDQRLSLNKSASTFAVDPGAISFCLFRNTFIWLNNGARFWYYPIFVGPRSVAGFRWNARFWTIFGVDTRQINSFSCF